MTNYDREVRIEEAKNGWIVYRRGWAGWGDETMIFTDWKKLVDYISDNFLKGTR